MKVSDLPYPDSDIVLGFSGQNQHYREVASELLPKIGYIPPSAEAYKCLCDDDWGKIETWRHHVDTLCAAFVKEADHFRELLKQAGIDIYQ